MLDPGPGRSPFAGAHALVTGGLGFIGSNLAIELAGQGAEVTIVDALLPGYGGNLFNIEPVRGRVRVNVCDIRDVNAMNTLVAGQDFVFHLAGQVDHILSLTDPFPDIDINVKGTAILMEALKHHNPKARVVYSGTRGEYGPAGSLPVSETAPTHPKGIYEISNLTAEKIISVYDEVHGIASVLLRITNVYGPRAQMRHSRHGVVNWFTRVALDGGPMKVFGDGTIKRDFLYVDDCIEAILTSAVSDAARGEILNVGSDRVTNFRQLAEELTALTGAPWEFAPFSPERKAQEPGDFVSDITKIGRLLGWRPKTPLSEGLTRTLAYYREHKSRYWP